jgi:hypothetical protein
MASRSAVLEKVQEVGFPNSQPYASIPGMPGQCKPVVNATPVIINGYGTCRNAFRCGCIGYVGWGNGYACSRCGCGFGEHY